jgi:hypothetical protein
MAGFAPARLAREAQGIFGNRMLPKPSCRVLGFGYFRRNESSSLAADQFGRIAELNAAGGPRGEPRGCGE